MAKVDANGTNRYQQTHSPVSWLDFRVGSPELHVGRVDPRVGSGQKIYKYEWVGSGPVR